MARLSRRIDFNAKSSIFICKLIVAISFLPSVFLFKGNYNAISRHLPEISAIRWTEYDGDDWQSDFHSFGEDAIEVRDNGKTWIVSQHMSAVAFTCNASYPITWVFEQSKYAHDDLFSISIRSTRKSMIQSTTSSTDLWNPRSQQFFSTIEIFGFYNRMTGLYGCRSTQDENIQSNLFLYWQGISASHLVLAGESLTISTSPDEKSVTLPCYVSHPKGQVTLLKDTGKEFVEISNSNEKDGIKSEFEPKIGFTLTATKSNISLLGKYKCTAYSTEDLILDVVPYGNMAKSPFENVVLSNATVFFDNQKDEIVCCSSTGRPPVFRDIFCPNVPTCHIHEQQLQKLENNGKRYKSGGCISSKIYPREFGMFRCKGDSIDVTRYFYTGYSEAGNDGFYTYLNYNEIQPQNLMRLISRINGSTVYNKQILSVSCLALPSYFSNGIRWGMKQKDGAITMLSNDAEDEHFDNRIFSKVDVTVSLDISEIICYVPVWNSTEWVHKSLPLNVIESIHPEIEEMQEEMYMSVDDTEQILECKSSGVPTPKVTWSKDDKLISLRSKNIWEANGTSVLIIQKVSHESAGKYKCSASNWAGSVQRTINIIVEDSGSAWSTASIATLSVVVIVLIAVTAFVLFKMQMKSKIIDHLTRIVFRDTDQTGRSTN